MNADSLPDETDKDAATDDVNSFNYTNVATYGANKNTSNTTNGNTSSISLPQQALNVAKELEKNVQSLEEVFSVAQNADSTNSAKSEDFSKRGHHPYQSVEEEFLEEEFNSSGKVVVSPSLKRHHNKHTSSRNRSHRASNETYEGRKHIRFSKSDATQDVHVTPHQKKILRSKERLA